MTEYVKFTNGTQYSGINSSTSPTLNPGVLPVEVILNLMNNSDSTGPQSWNQWGYLMPENWFTKINSSLFWGNVNGNRRFALTQMTIDMEIRVNCYMRQPNAGGAQVAGALGPVPLAIPGLAAWWAPNYAVDLANSETFATPTSDHADESTTWVKAYPGKDGVYRKRIFWKNKSPFQQMLMDPQQYPQNDGTTVGPLLDTNFFPYHPYFTCHPQANFTRNANLLFKNAHYYADGIRISNMLRIPGFKFLCPGIGAAPYTDATHASQVYYACDVLFVINNKVVYTGIEHGS